METPPKKSPNPKRVAAGKLNRSKRGPISSIGKAKLRLAIYRVKPWLLSTGPKTSQGKAESARNGLLRVKNGENLRKVRRNINKISQMMKELRDLRDEIG
jgi:hypothetical protein